MKPRILIYSTAYYPLVGGAEVAVKEITDRLPDLEFDLVTARHDRKLPSRERIGNVTVYRLGWGTRWDKIYLAFLGGRFGRELHRKKPYQLVWAIMASFGGLAAAGFKVKEQAVPFLLTLQEGDELTDIERKARLVKSLWREIFKSADFVQCISHFLADWAKRMGAVCPIEIVPNGVDLNQIKNEELRINNKKQAGEKIIITTSRLVKKNGLDDLIRSLSHLDANIRLWILGVGPEEEALKGLSKDLNLGDRVKFFGFVPNPELFSYLREADIFIRPSLSEGLGNSFLEAMACGLPTVGTPVGGIPDFLKEGETGWLSPVHDPAAIALKVKYLLDPTHQEEVKKVTEQGRKLVQEKYDWNIIAGAMNEIFKNLIK